MQSYHHRWTFFIRYLSWFGSTPTRQRLRSWLFIRSIVFAISNGIPHDSRWVVSCLRLLSGSKKRYTPTCSREWDIKARGGCLRGVLSLKRLSVTELIWRLGQEFSAQASTSERNFSQSIGSMLIDSLLRASKTVNGILVEILLPTIRWPSHRETWGYRSKFEDGTRQFSR